MINGFFGNSMGDQNNRVIAILSDGEKHASLLTNTSIAHTRIHSLSVLLTNFENRSIYISHLGCRGASCPCRKFAHDFVSSEMEIDMEDPSTIETSLETHEVTFPAMYIFMESNITIVAQTFSSSEMTISIVPPGQLYVIRDFMFKKVVQECSIETNVQETNVAECTPIEETPPMPNELGYIFDINKDAQSACESLIEVLHKSVRGWPLKCDGCGLLTLRRQDEVTPTLFYVEAKVLATKRQLNASSSFGALLHSSINDSQPIVKPKGFVTSFNFFSKIIRTQVLRISDICLYYIYCIYCIYCMYCMYCIYCMYSTQQVALPTSNNFVLCIL